MEILEKAIQANYSQISQWGMSGDRAASFL